MNEHILNVITQLLAYSDPSVTDNPHQRAFDHTRRLQSLPVKNPKSDALRLAPGASFTVFNGTVATGLTGSSVLDMQLLSTESSVYRISVSAGPSSFRTARTPSGISAAAVTINNNAVAEFDFTGATLSGVTPGDVMRIKGAVLYDSGAMAFNPLNAGLWKVLAVSGTKVSAVRPVGEAFSGVAENVASAAADVQFYADDGVQSGDKFEISGSFSPATNRVYEVLDATPTTIDFVSATPLPLESSVAYVSGSINVYKSSKKLVYIEVDQEAVVRFNADASDNNKLTPISTGDKDLPAYLHKWGDAYSCTVVNKSMNPMSVKFFMAE